jgi:hypothetical protein
LAWYTAALTRKKKLPELKSLMAEVQKGRQTASQIKQSLEMIFGSRQKNPRGK